MTYIYIAATLLICFFLMRNIAATFRYRECAKCSEEITGSSVLVFDDTRQSHKISRIIWGVFFVLMLLLLIYLGFFKHALTLQNLLAGICVTAGCALFSFVPYTAGRWVVLKDGLFLYNYNTTINFSEMIAVRIMAKGNKSYLMLTLKKGEDETIKQITYPLLVPNDRAEDMRLMIRDMINAEERQRRRIHPENPGR